MFQIEKDVLIYTTDWLQLPTLLFGAIAVAFDTINNVDYTVFFSPPPLDYTDCNCYRIFTSIIIDFVLFHMFFFFPNFCTKIWKKKIRKVKHNRLINSLSLSLSPSLSLSLKSITKLQHAIKKFVNKKRKKNVCFNKKEGNNCKRN